MKKVRIADLKAHLSQHLRAVRGGETITVYDRETPIAHIVPIERPTEGLVVRGPSVRGRPADVPLPPPLGRDIDIVALLLEERQNGR